MSSGIHSTVLNLEARLFDRWCPKWRGAFEDSAGGFYERLGHAFQPVSTGQRRLLTQCRQISIYSDLFFRNKSALYGDLDVFFELILGRYHDAETGQWAFSVNDSGDVVDETCDLYALAFVIFSFSHYFRATKDARAKHHALAVLRLIDSKFRLQQGLAEAIDSDGVVIPKTRRQNPHMHLLEACLFAYGTWKDPAFLSMADEMIFLFYNYFLDRDTKASVIEFFTDDLAPHPDQGGSREPGHSFEWVWLLKKHAALKGDPARHDDAALRLFDWANRHGWDAQFGGIYDTLDPAGNVLSDTKRIWPFCEALKANALMLTSAPDRQAVKDRTADMVRVFRDKYMDARGFWTEILNRDLSPVTDYMPGTTPYHVYFGITETMDVLNARGGSKSLQAGLARKIYTVRRAASARMRRILGR